MLSSSAMAFLSVLAVTLASLPPAWLPAVPPGRPTAVVERGEHVLLGTERGLYRQGPAGWSVVLTRGGVRDLARGRAGTLIATGAGLYEWPLDREQPRALALGAGARVRAVAVDVRGDTWVASEVGLFVRSSGGRVFHRETGIPAGEVLAVRAAGEEIWLATRGTLWSGSRPGAFEPRLRELEAGWWELLGVVRVPAGALLAVPRGLWLLADPPRNRSFPALPARSITLGIGEIHALARAAGQVWVASRRGVFTLDPGRVEHAAARARLDAEALDLEPAARGLLAATLMGVAMIPLGRAEGASRGLERISAAEPGVRAVQRAVLRYLELSPSRLQEVESRARRAAWYPQLRTTLSADRDLRRDVDHDQTFSSGQVRNLLDRGGQRDSSRGIDIQLVWELGKAADPGDALAVSRERRQLIELRDQVLERVNRLYFERLRLLAQVQALPPGSRRERREVELQAREIEAHLDAWTGGVFSRLLSHSPRSHGRGP